MPAWKAIPDERTALAIRIRAGAATAAEVRRYRHLEAIEEAVRWMSSAGWL